MSIYHAWHFDDMCRPDWAGDLMDKYEEFLHSDFTKSDIKVFSDEDLDRLDEMVAEAEDRIYRELSDYTHSNFLIVSKDRPVVEAMINYRKTGRGLNKIRKLINK